MREKERASYNVYVGVCMYVYVYVCEWKYSAFLCQHLFAVLEKKQNQTWNFSTYTLLPTCTSNTRDKIFLLFPSLSLWDRTYYIYMHTYYVKLSNLKLLRNYVPHFWFSSNSHYTQFNKNFSIIIYSFFNFTFSFKLNGWKKKNWSSRIYIAAQHNENKFWYLT